MTGVVSSAVSDASLGRLMPLHLCVDRDGLISDAGPTIRKIAPQDDLIGQTFFEVFTILRPQSVASIEDLKTLGGETLKLCMKDEAGVPFRALVVPSGDGVFLNLSFGYALVEAVRRHGLTNEDFAPTDLAIEMLYLVEAKSSAFDESRRLIGRLNDARSTAEEQANTDMLTGLSNRRALLEGLDELALREAEFALMQIDLDFFKDVNDTHGHAAGDHVLIEVGRILREETRAGDTVARMGGDEFVILLNRLVEPVKLSEISARLIEKLEHPIQFGDLTCGISASIGTTLSTLYDAPSGDRMLRDADAALYQSKRQGRQQATHLSAETLARGELEEILQAGGATLGI